MAIITFALTKEEFLSGNKTVTRRDWSDRQFETWCRFWGNGRYVHDAWDKAPHAGGKKIGRFVLTCRPYLEQLWDMPPSDLEAECGMCETVDEFCRLIGKTPDDTVTVIRFERVG